MGNCKKCNNHRNQNQCQGNRRKEQSRDPRQSDIQPIADMLVKAAEFCVPCEENYVNVPVSDYDGLVSNNALLAAVKRYIASDGYNSHSVLRAILGMPKGDDE